MADLDFDELEGGYHVSRGGAGRWVHLAGAACSVAIALGVVVWGYKLAVRDVTGVPVVRAVEGPLRISPDNPGGNVALHQGLSVNAVAAVGVAAPLPEIVTLAPEEAVLDPEDAPGLAVLANGPARTEIEGLTEVSVSAPAAVGVNLKPLEVAMEPVVVLETPVDVAAIAVDEAVPETQEDAVAAALAIALADVPEGVTQVAAVTSLRPKARPASGAAIESVVTAAAAGVDAPVELVSVTASKGDRLVQLGVFDDEAGARAKWVALQAQFPELMARKALVVEAAQSGGQAFYRLRAHGFESEDETRRFCNAFISGNADCMAVEQR